MQCAKEPEQRKKATQMSSVGGNWDWISVERWTTPTDEGWLCRKWEYVLYLGGHLDCLLLENMQNIAKCCCVTNVEATTQPAFFMALCGLVFTPDYMDWCNGGVACQGKESSSVWLSVSIFTWAAKPAAKKKPQRTTGPTESLGLLSTKCHRSRQPCHENLNKEGPLNIQPMPGVLEIQKKKKKGQS